MAVTGALIPEGSRVRVRRGRFPLDPAVVGRAGTVVSASEYRAYAYGVTLDGEQAVRYFAPEELEVTSERLPPDREAAKRRRALP